MYYSFNEPPHALRGKNTGEKDEGLCALQYKRMCCVTEAQTSQTNGCRDCNVHPTISENNQILNNAVSFVVQE